MTQGTARYSKCVKHYKMDPNTHPDRNQKWHTSRQVNFTYSREETKPINEWFNNILVKVTENEQFLWEGLTKKDVNRTYLIMVGYIIQTTLIFLKSTLGKLALKPQLQTKLPLMI